MLHILSVNT